MNEALSIFNIGQHQEQMNAAMFDPSFEKSLFDPKVKEVGESTSFIR